MKYFKYIITAFGLGIVGGVCVLFLLANGYDQTISIIGIVVNVCAVMTALGLGISSFRQNSRIIEMTKDKWEADKKELRRVFITRIAGVLGVWSANLITVFGNPLVVEELPELPQDATTFGGYLYYLDETLWKEYREIVRQVRYCMGDSTKPTYLGDLEEPSVSGWSHVKTLIDEHIEKLNTAI